MFNMRQFVCFAVLTVLMIGCGDSDDFDGVQTVSGDIEPGKYLSLAHNTGRNDLLFKAQFEKDNIIYDYAEYPDHFTPASGDPIDLSIEASGSYDMAAAKLGNGNFAVVYSG